jgi:hypothetical protein
MFRSSSRDFDGAAASQPESRAIFPSNESGPHNGGPLFPSCRELADDDANAVMTIAIAMLFTDYDLLTVVVAPAVIAMALLDDDGLRTGGIACRGQREAEGSQGSE